MIRFLPFAVLTALLALLPEVPACAPAPRPGEYVEITDESALIIWDEESKTEHFIRRAKFQSTSQEFGFLVPTPNQPELAESDDAVFSMLSTYTAPKVEYITVRKPRPKPTGDQSKAMAPGFAGSAAKPDAPPRGVEVLESTEVGGMEAVVLKFHRGPKPNLAEDAKELAGWLKDHGYEFGPQLAGWLKPYIENGWVMTAFRVARRAPVSKTPNPAAPKPAWSELQGKPIRMSFKTEKPFYPYREPEEPKAKTDARKPTNPYQNQRFLRVFFLGSKRYAGTLGVGNTSWNASTPWSDKLNDAQLQKVSATAKLPEAALKNAAWLTEFEDRSSPRQGTDEVYYKPSDQGTVHRPTIIREVVEYYDEPGGPSESVDAEPKFPRWVMLVAVVGGVGFLAVLGGLLFVIMKQR